MPEPKEGESSKDFVSRCIPYLINEGKHPNTPEGRKAAAGECYGIYRSKKKSDEPKVKAGLKDRIGYFCKIEEVDKRFYYEIDNKNSKDKAITDAKEHWHDIQIDKLFKSFESTPKEEEKVIESIPKSKEELKSGDTISYKGKKAKILKVLEK